MKKWQRELTEHLYDITNKIGSVGDLTAISTKKLVAYTRANQQVSMIIDAMFFEENENKAKKLTEELELLARWNFPDKHGDLSDDEILLNDQLEYIAKERGLQLFF